MFFTQYSGSLPASAARLISLAALALKWRVIAKTFQGLRGREAGDGGDFPMRWVVWGALAAAATLAAVQKISLGFPLWYCVISFLLLFVVLLKLRIRVEEQQARVDALYLALDERS